MVVEYILPCLTLSFISKDQGYSTNTLGKGMNPNILPLAMGK